MLKSTLNYYVSLPFILVLDILIRYISPLFSPIFHHLRPLQSG